VTDVDAQAVADDVEQQRSVTRSRSIAANNVRRSGDQKPDARRNPARSRRQVVKFWRRS
jgi:hypothetical protein